MGLHVVLYQPEIPANTGNIARTCAATDTKLHIIRPLGFSTDDKRLKRAGLDYWEFVNFRLYDSLEEFYERNKGGEFFYLTKHGKKAHTAYRYNKIDKEYYFIFGRETDGLPERIIQSNLDHALRVPMNEKVSALNLSNTAAVLIYEALRQQSYPNLR